MHFTQLLLANNIISIDGGVQQTIVLRWFDIMLLKALWHYFSVKLKNYPLSCVHVEGKFAISLFDRHMARSYGGEQSMYGAS